MKLSIGIAAALSLSATVAAQADPWAQCGGNNWSGPTTCPSGYVCTEQNEWYWQCVPGDDTAPNPSTTFSTVTTSELSPSTTSSISQGDPSTPPSTCDGALESMSAADYVEAMNPGWNLGNTLDAIPNEDSWNNNPVEEQVFDYVVEQGFKSVRIPVTYTHHLNSGSPDWTIDPDWLQRVSDVVDMALERDLHVITNVHHDSWEWADVTSPGADIAEIQERFRAIWYQIGVKLGCKSSLVTFESINEPPADTAEHGALINEFNEIFLEAINASGGFNSERVVQLTGPVSDPLRTTQWFEPPADIQNPWALQFHYYAPYDFIFSAWGRTIWGSDEDRALLTGELAMVRGNFSDVPLVLGEYDASPLNTEPAARWKYFDHLARVATELDISLVIWDNGLDHLDRNAGTWWDPVSLAIIDAAIAGEPNSLPDSTTDQSAEEQWTSAFIWNRAGEEVEDYELPWLFNGNSLVSVTTETGDVLTEGQDYTSSADSISFTETFLSQYLGPEIEEGSKANLTLTFSAGAFSMVHLVQWDTPELLAEPEVTPGQDLNIPIDYNGWRMVAAVRIVAVDGTILFDDWTQWLGPLQSGRATFNNHWFFDGEQVVIRAAAIQAVIDLGQPVDFEFEFYPRVEGNSVTITLDPADF